jgi:hypothetical protein
VHIPLLALVVDSLHPDEVDHTAELVLDTDRDLDGGGRDAKLVPDLLDNTPRVCSRSVGDFSKC